LGPPLSGHLVAGIDTTTGQEIPMTFLVSGLLITILVILAIIALVVFILGRR
jgi:hypothetical protein